MRFQQVSKEEIWGGMYFQSLWYGVVVGGCINLYYIDNFCWKMFLNFDFFSDQYVLNQFVWEKVLQNN